MPIDQKIKNIMYGHGRIHSSPLGFFLWIVSILYGTILRLRNSLYRWRILRSKQLPCVVISIGNITLGGTGKTPMTIYMARLLDQLGYNIAVISRGYKGSAEKTGGIISDGDTLLSSVNEAGDEPIMMAAQLKNIPILVGKNRFKMGMIAKKKFDSTVILLDDAFQHLKLKRDIDIVLLDSSHPFGNTYMFPRGTLREPVSGLMRGDAYIMTRADQKANVSLPDQSDHILKELLKDVPVFKAYHTAYYFTVSKGSICPLEILTQNKLSNDLTFLENQDILAFSGIAENHHFRCTVEALSCEISEFLNFPDHYRYSNADLDDIVSKAKKLNVKYIMTTEKDFMRIYHSLPWPVDLVVIGVNISFEDHNAFRTFIKNRLETSEKEKYNTIVWNQKKQIIEKEGKMK